jgi:hypothetical protein
MSALRAGRVGDHGEHGFLFEDRHGAGDESSGSIVAGDGEENHMVSSEILGFTDRHVRRIRERYQEFGYDGLFDRRRGKPSPKRVPLATVEAVLGCIASSISI